MTLRTLSISGLATLNLHSLNNEGGEGNQIQTRMVDVIAKNERGEFELHPVNAVSGDMFKHIFTAHYHAIAVEMGLTLCQGCKTMNANRLNADSTFGEAAKNKDNSSADLLNLLSISCALDDVAGILITQGSRSLGRKSVVEFSWVPGAP